MIVPDASVILEVLLQTHDAESVQTRLLDTGASLHAPHLLDVEVAQVLRRYALRGDVSAHRGVEALELLAAFPIARYSHEPLLPRIWSLRSHLTAYDAAYVALAEGIGAVLLTRDRRLAAATGHRARIELI